MKAGNKRQVANLMTGMFLRPHHHHLIMARIGKSAAVDAAVDAIQRGDFTRLFQSSEAF